MRSAVCNCNVNQLPVRISFVVHPRLSALFAGAPAAATAADPAVADAVPVARPSAYRPVSTVRCEYAIRGDEWIRQCVFRCELN